MLRQNTANQAGIVRLLVEAREKWEGSLVKARSNQAEWKAIVSEVDGFVRVMPLWKLQKVGRERLDFLYDNAGRGTQITLKPGMAFCMRKYCALVAAMACCRFLVSSKQVLSRRNTPFAFGRSFCRNMLKKAIWRISTIGEVTIGKVGAPL